MTPTPIAYAAAAQLAATQHHLVTRTQLQGLSVSKQQIHDWTSGGLLTRVEPNVFLTAGGFLTWRAKTLALCLSASGIASHRTAASLYELEGCRPGPPEISIPRGQHVRRERDRIHESGDLELFTPRIVDGIPTTPPARTILDLGAVAPHLVENAARDAVSRRIVTWPELLNTLVQHSRRGRAGCGSLRSILDEHFGDRTESVLERRFLRLIRASGLPTPEEQVDAHDENGFIMRIDFAYPELLVAIEIDSIQYHATMRAFEADPIKRNRLKIAGWLLLEFTSQRIRERPTRVLEEVGAAIRSRQRLMAQTGATQVS